ncbi:MAG: hypothetical protein MR639_02260 [Clostridium sp.]|nr:hypothetical protein [Clostridium sp.]MDY5097945.1 hypothetical protein [Clostridium sp.]
MNKSDNILSELLKSLCYKKTDDASKSHSSCQCKIDPSGGLIVIAVLMLI